MAAERSTKAEVGQEAIPLGIGKQESYGPNPKLGLGLAILLGIAVFALLWRIRKTFGMKE